MKDAEKEALKDLDGELTREMEAAKPDHEKLAALIDVEEAIKARRAGGGPPPAPPAAGPGLGGTARRCSARARNGPCFAGPVGGRRREALRDRVLTVCAQTAAPACRAAGAGPPARPSPRSRENKHNPRRPPPKQRPNNAAPRKRGGGRRPELAPHAEPRRSLSGRGDGVGVLPMRGFAPPRSAPEHARARARVCCIGPDLAGTNQTTAINCDVNGKALLPYNDVHWAPRRGGRRLADCATGPGTSAGGRVVRAAPAVGGDARRWPPLPASATRRDCSLKPPNARSSLFRLPCASWAAGGRRVRVFGLPPYAGVPIRNSFSQL